MCAQEGQQWDGPQKQEMVFQVEVTGILSLVISCGWILTDWLLIAVLFHLVWINLSNDSMVQYLDSPEVAQVRGRQPFWVCVWSVAQVWQSAKDAKCHFAEFWPTFQQESVSIMKVKEQKAMLRKQQSLFTAASKKASALTQASLKVAEHKSPSVMAV